VVTNEVKERFVALAGGPSAQLVYIPTALSDEQIGDPQKRAALKAREFGVSRMVVLHTRDRVRANSDGFVEPLRHASGVWIDGGRQWRLADAYLNTAIEREIRALVARGGVVGGGSAGATIQGSFLVRGAPGTPTNPDGDNRIMMSPGHEIGFGLLPNSAIDQHVDARGREADLESVIAAHPTLLGIGIDQSAAIIVHGDSFFVVGGQIVIHDGKAHDGAPYYFLSPGQSFNLKTRLPAPVAESPLVLTVETATRSQKASSISTVGEGLLQSRDSSPIRVRYECGVSLYSAGGEVYPAIQDGPGRFRVEAREVNQDTLRDYSCRF